MTWRWLFVALMASCRPAPAGCPETPTPGCPEPPVSPPETARTLDEVTVAERPDWTDKYSHLNEGDMRFFDIDGLMDRYGLSRAAAIELQNHYRDLSRTAEGTEEDWFRSALDRAQNGDFEDRRDLATLRKAPFIVAFDLDETLYDQYYAADLGEACHDVAIPSPDGPRYLKLAPGWDAAIRRIRQLGGAIVLFSANTDPRTIENLRAITLDDKPLTEHPAISAVLTNSHLILQTKERGTPVVEPSKDLRVFDETLDRVIIVDDNPTRLFQYDRARVTPALHAETLCEDEPTSPARRLAERTLAEVVREIEEADTYRKAEGVAFATAFMPYSETGRRWIAMAVAVGIDREQAMQWLRRHPEAAD